MKQQSLAIPILLAVGLHLALAALLFFNGDVFNKPKDNPVLSSSNKAQIVETVSVDSKKVKDLVKKIKKKKAAEIKKQRALERRLAQLEKKRKAAEKKSRQARKKQAKEEKLAKAAAKKRKLQEKKAKEAADKRKKQDKLAKESAEKLKKQQQLAEEARKKREKEELERQMQQEMEEQLQLEQQRLNEAKEKRILTETEKYKALIVDRIYTNLVAGVDAVVRIKLAPGGLVIDVNCVEGDTVACKAAIVAVKKAEPLPVSKDADVFRKLRDIRLKINKKVEEEL
ncbi:MAG TPA: cell envelope integrity protein TolA [Aeromonadales bacterium]|nr:cell envelope integrity protein TolA [Aeromonadales bacterium]